jgi:hypothetical protein
MAFDEQDLELPCLLQEAETLIESNEYACALERLKLILQLTQENNKEQYVSSCIEASTCCSLLQLWNDTYEYAKLALDSISDQDRGERRVKALLLMSRALSRQRRTKEAIQLLSQARAVTRERHGFKEKVESRQDSVQSEPAENRHNRRRALELRLEQIRNKTALLRKAMGSMDQMDRRTMEISICSEDLSEITTPTVTETEPSYEASYEAESSCQEPEEQEIERNERKEEPKAETIVKPHLPKQHGRVFVKPPSPKQQRRVTFSPDFISDAQRARLQTRAFVASPQMYKEVKRPVFPDLRQSLPDLVLEAAAEIMFHQLEEEEASVGDDDDSEQAVADDTPLEKPWFRHPFVLTGASMATGFASILVGRK